METDRYGWLHICASQSRARNTIRKDRQHPRGTFKTCLPRNRRPNSCRGAIDPLPNEGQFTLKGISHGPEGSLQDFFTPHLLHSPSTNSNVELARPKEMVLTHQIHRKSAQREVGFMKSLFRGLKGQDRRWRPHSPTGFCHFGWRH